VHSLNVVSVNDSGRASQTSWSDLVVQLANSPLEHSFRCARGRCESTLIGITSTGTKYLEAPIMSNPSDLSADKSQQLLWLRFVVTLSHQLADLICILTILKRLCVQAEIHIQRADMGIVGVL